MKRFGTVDADRDIMSSYREMRPPAHLAKHVECFWWRRPGEGPTAAAILPDGCVDIIWVDGLDPFVAGPATLPVQPVIDSSAGICGVRFRPGVGRHILGIDLHEVRDRHALLRDLWSHGQFAVFAEATERPTLAARLDAVSALLAERLGTGTDADPLVRDAVTWIVAHPRCRAEGIAQRYGVSDRQMRRRFVQSVGYGPKMLQRVLRMQRVLWLANADTRVAPNLVRLAHAAGYADQAHMSRELATLTGLTPRQLLLGARRDCAVSDLFKTTVGRDATMAL
jgi:AraC-like DNA-binding protein